MTIMFDRIVSVGGWLHSVDERDIGTEFPLRSLDFEHGVGVALQQAGMCAHTVARRMFQATPKTSQRRRSSRAILRRIRTPSFCS